MSVQRYAVIRDGYVVNTVLWDAEASPDWAYPHPHDSIMLLDNDLVGIGDWHEEAEDIFYRPLSTPPDIPQELQTPTE